MQAEPLTDEEQARLTLEWDDELRACSGYLQRKSQAAAVMVLLVDPAFLSRPDGLRLLSGITGSRRASADMMSAALRELADQIDDDAEKIASGVAFVSDTDEAPKGAVS